MYTLHFPIFYIYYDNFFLYDSICITFQYKLKKTIWFRDACLSGRTLQQMKEMITMMLGNLRLWGEGKHVRLEGACTGLLGDWPCSISSLGWSCPEAHFAII